MQQKCISTRNILSSILKSQGYRDDYEMQEICQALQRQGLLAILTANELSFKAS